MGADRQIPADDWTDQDLLTKDEARERLVREIEVESAVLAALVRDSGAREELQLRERRLSALKVALSRL
jgi:hypothetical protein